MAVRRRDVGVGGVSPSSARAGVGRQRKPELGRRQPPRRRQVPKSSAPPCCSITVRHRLRPRPMPSLRVVKNGVNSRCATSGGDAGAAVDDAERDPARMGLAHAHASARARPAACAASIAWMPLRVRFSSTCSTIVRSHTTRGTGCGQVDLDARAALARLQPHQRQHRVDQRVAAHRLARLLAPAHEVVHALDHAPGALGLLGDALGAWRSSAAVSASCGVRLAAGSASRWRSWRSPPAAGSARGSAARPSRRRWPAARVACSRSCCWRDSSSTRRCSLTSSTALIQPVWRPRPSTSGAS